ncbi:MAG: STAS domain-containing protein [Fibrobacteres bacterium]|nr:STAS domain-containing protein [Fibrobacterota bacterium]
MKERVYTVPDVKTAEFPIHLMKEGMANLEDPDGGNLVLDLAAAKTIDSRSVGAVVNLTNRYCKTGRKFVLRNVNDSVRKIFDFMNLTPFLAFEETKSAKKAEDACEVLTVDYDTIRGIGVFRFTGAINSSYDSAMFLNIVNKIVGDGSPMLVDMSGITTIDSLGVGVIIRLIKLMREGRAEVRFFGVSPYLQEIFQVNQLDNVIHIFPTADEALRGWQVSLHS